MPRSVQFVTPSARAVRLVPDKPGVLGLRSPESDRPSAPSSEDEADADLQALGAALYWYKKQELTEDE